jgi:hypothetical protein
LFRGQYPLLGNATVLPVKVIWDYAFYWGVLCQLVFQQRLTDLAVLGRVQADLARARGLNLRMQQQFRDWHAIDPGHGQREMLDQCSLAWFTELNRGLHDALDETGLAARLAEHADLLEALADAIVLQAARGNPALRAPLSGRTPPALFAHA